MSSVGMLSMKKLSCARDWACFLSLASGTPIKLIDMKNIRQAELGHEQGFKGKLDAISMSFRILKHKMRQHVYLVKSVQLD